MFDISWSEFLVIGVVALVVIGPKELPGVLRTLGQYTRKVRRMATEFQNQFQEAMREAEMADLKKEVDAMASDIKNYDPLKDVRGDVEAMGKDIESSLKAEPTPAAPKAEPPIDGGFAVSDGALGVAAPEAAAPVTPVESSALEPAAAEPVKTEPAKIEPAAETQLTPADNATERPA
jgi:sec-independent protein translocase protein TatB